MNSKIESIFAELKNPNPQVHAEAALVLGCLLERTMWPGRHDSEHLVFLPKELATLKLDTETEREPFIERMRLVLQSENVSVGAKISLSTFLAKTAREDCIRSILELLKARIESLTDEEAYGLIAAILPRASRSLLRGYGPTLNHLLARRSERLNQPVTMALNSIRGTGSADEAE